MNELPYENYWAAWGMLKGIHRFLEGHELNPHQYRAVQDALRDIETYIYLHRSDERRVKE